MRYLLMLYSAENAGPTPGSPEHAAEMQEWFAATNAMQEAGVFVSGEPLHGIDTATTIRGQGDDLTITDGPFAETKEVLGGFYLIDVADLDDATKWAATLPIVRYGSVEARPVLELPGS